MKPLFTIRPRRYRSMTVLLAITISSGGLISCNPTELGALGGAGAGAAIGQALGHNTRSTLAGAAIGGILGAIVGHLLTPEEQNNYNRNVNEHLKQQPDNQQGDTTLTVGNKQVATKYSEAATLDDFKNQSASGQGQQQVAVNDEMIQKNNLSGTSLCRRVDRKVMQNGSLQGEDSMLYCRDANGDYLPIDQPQVAQNTQNTMAR